MTWYYISMKKLNLTIFAMFVTMLASCGGMPGLILTPSNGSYVYGDLTASYIVITGAPTDSIIHYNITTDGTAVPQCYCNACTYVYDSDTDIPLYPGVTNVNAVACDANGAPVTANGTAAVTITEAP